MRAAEYCLIAIRDTSCLMTCYLESNACSLGCQVLSTLQRYIPTRSKTIRFPTCERISLGRVHLRCKCCKDINYCRLRAVIAPERLYLGSWEIFCEETHIARCSTPPAVDSLSDIPNNP